MRRWFWLSSKEHTWDRCSDSNPHAPPRPCRLLRLRCCLQNATSKLAMADIILEKWAVIEWIELCFVQFPHKSKHAVIPVEGVCLIGEPQRTHSTDCLWVLWGIDWRLEAWRLTVKCDHRAWIPDYPWGRLKLKFCMVKIRSGTRKARGVC